MLDGTEPEERIPQAFPPWTSKPSYKVNIEEGTKDKLAEYYKLKYNSVNWAKTTHIYTDSSLHKESIGIGIGFVATNSIGQFTYKSMSNIGDKNLVYNGELEAITQALEFASARCNPGHHFEIFSDNQAALQRLASLSDYPGQSCQMRALNAANQITDKNASISLHWIPGHLGIEGNEIADQLAKDASKLAPRNNKISFAMIGAQMKKNFQNQWLEFLQNNDRKIHPRSLKYQKQFHWKINHKIQVPSVAKRAVSSAYFQLKLGHGYNKAYLYKQGKTTNDQCRCGKRETPDHLILSCSNYKHKRKELIKKMNGNNLTMRLLLHTKIGIEKVIEFIDSTRISTRGWHLERREENFEQD